jgi:hypothetical protein
MNQAFDHVMQFLGRGIAWLAGFIQQGWAWSSEQIVKLTQASWDTWPLWKKVLLVIVVALVAYALFIAARRLWQAVLNLLPAVATFIGALLMTLPTILIAGAIALAGVWVINNFDDLSSLRSLITGHTTGLPGADN